LRAVSWDFQEVGCCVGGRRIHAEERIYHFLVLLLPCSPLLKILLSLVWGFSKFPCPAGLDEGIKFLVGVSIDVMEVVTFHGALMADDLVVFLGAVFEGKSCKKLAVVFFWANFPSGVDLFFPALGLLPCSSAAYLGESSSGSLCGDAGGSRI